MIQINKKSCATFITLLFLCACSLSSPARQLYVEDSMTIDFVATASNLIVETDPDRIFYITINAGVNDHQQIIQALAVNDIEFQSVLFPSQDARSSNTISFYSKSNRVAVQFNPPDNQFSLQLKMEKAVDCPPNLGGNNTECARIVDEVSCYCINFDGKTWIDARAFCRSNGMNFVAIDNQAENDAIWNTYGENYLQIWIGGSDILEEGRFTWEATGGLVSAGYQNWWPGEPNDGLSTSTGEDCMLIAYAGDSYQRPLWNDANCTIYLLRHVCELQP